MSNSSLIASEFTKLEAGLDCLKKTSRLKDSELRILICTATYFVPDGVTHTIRSVESHLRSKGATVKILSTVPPTIDPKLLENVIVVPGIKIPFKNAGDYSLGIGLNEATIRLIEDYKPNCVHFTVPDFVGLDGIRWCQKNNVAYIGTWHSNYCEYLKYYYLEWVLGPGFHRYLKGFFEQIPTVYIPTEYMFKKVRDEWGYGSATELKVWGRGVDMDIFSPSRRSESYRLSKGFQPHDVVVTWVGRLVPEKRPDIWMYVVQRLQAEGLSVKPLVVGTGTFDKHLAKINHVAVTGWISGPALGEAYASSDILLFPSDVETFGNVTLEALCAGCPAIVERKCGGHLVEEGKNGLTCPAGDFEAFYQATRRLVVDTAMRQQMGRDARVGARRFERGVILQQMAENYKDAITKHSDPCYIEKHLENHEGGGRNMLAYLCCNYHFVKQYAEPFLNTSGGVQRAVDSTAECIEQSRANLTLSCCGTNNIHTVLSNNTLMTSRLSLSNIDQSDIENLGDHTEDGAKRDRSFTFWRRYFGASCTPINGAKLFNYFTMLLSYGIVVVLVYLSFTMRD